jgi:AraC-like DNA-binding protein
MKDPHRPTDRPTDRQPVSTGTSGSETGRRRGRRQRTNRQLSDLTKRVLEDIDARACDEHIRLAHIAAAVGRSESLVSHLLNLETGRPFPDHVADARLKRAMVYLLDRRNTVKDAARMVGWYSEQLIRCFRHALGVTPGEWRKRQWARQKRHRSGTRKTR